jgi:hypothetical protein
MAPLPAGARVRTGSAPTPLAWAGATVIALGFVTLANVVAWRQAPQEWWNWLPVRATAVCYVILGAHAWRTGRSVGPLLMACGATAFIGDLYVLAHPAPSALAFCLAYLLAREYRQCPSVLVNMVVVSANAFSIAASGTRSHIFVPSGTGLSPSGAATPVASPTSPAPADPSSAAGPHPATGGRKPAAVSRQSAGQRSEIPLARVPAGGGRIDSVEPG